ncbi:hypothetical protein BWI17_02230 [Betaproteobacteria bacterium GR16-43]|nr:hypothetical protein BWI17_02230 [Betaproteobacteria bacterium GR16-43]
MRRKVRSRIFDAIERGDEDAVIRLASSGRLVRARDEFGSRPLVASIAAKRSRIAIDLIARDGYVRGDGAVAHAVMWGDLAVLKALIESAADLNEPLPAGPNEKGWTPLMWATNRHNFEAMKLLLAAGGDVNAIAGDGTTALMCTRAGTDDDLIALDILCAYKPELTVKDWRGRTILDEARDRARFSSKTGMRDILHRHYPELAVHEA